MLSYCPAVSSICKTNRLDCVGNNSQCAPKLIPPPGGFQRRTSRSCLRPTTWTSSSTLGGGGGDATGERWIVPNL